MFRRWLAARKSLVVTATSGSVVAVLIATIAMVSGGYEAKRLDLGDGSVWVANGSRQVVGRANTEILALDTVVGSTGSAIDVQQAGTTILVNDQTNSKADVIDPATAKVVESVPLPPTARELFLAGSNAVIHSPRTGEVWIVRLADLRTFDAGSTATLSLGADSAVSVSPDGTLFLFSKAAREVYRVDAATGDAVRQTSPADFGGPDGSVSITSVAGRWVLLDTRSGRLSIEGRIVDLAGELGGAPNAVLERASDTGDRVLVAYPGGVLSVALTGGTPTRVASSEGGTPVAPVEIAGCAYAAWSGGNSWRQCAGESLGSQTQLAGVPTTATRLAFAVNGSRVVLTDPVGGGSWAVQRGGELISNWDSLIVVDPNRRRVDQTNSDTPPVYEKSQVPPVAVADSFGARPGRANVLPVLLNDYDPNGDVLVIDSVDAIDQAIGRIDVINNRQQLLLTLTGAATGPISFGYTISDGRGGSASAQVTVAVRAPGENSAPVQVRPSRAIVAQGSRVSTSVLGDWVDPDGDAFYLTSAAATAPDSATYKPEGLVMFQDGGAAGDSRSVALAVSDGSAVGAGSLAVTVRVPGSVPIVAEPFVVVTYAGQQVTISPLDYVRGGTGALRLTSVPAKPGATIDASLESGTFRFSSDQVRTHNLEYVVGDGEQTVTGVIRVDVAAPPDPNTKPITIPKTVFVQTLSSKTVDVASSDIDPAGGVLLVTGVDNIRPGSGVQADVLEQRAIRVTLVAPLESRPVLFTYRITNGLAQADGTITVIEIPRPTRLQPPVATDDTVTVRLGDAIDIPVLANDVHPDGEPLTLNPRLTTGLAGDSGLLFASGNVLRYLAPNRTGNFTAVYEVAGPDGQVAQAQVRIAVREAVPTTNAAPVPLSVTARVLAGQTVRIPIPLTGIDPDGDSVQLLGQDTSPEKGSVTEVGSDYINYLAGSYSAGTDTFTYSVIDALGARATGTVRVGVSPRGSGARNPIAVADTVRSRPGNSVSVQVLANDSDPDGSALTVLSVEPNSPDITWSVLDNIVTVTPPPVPGRYGLVYTIQNAAGGTSSNYLTVVVDPEAPPAYPVAKDTVLTLSDILDRTTVSVDVLRNVFFADGDVSALSLSVLPGYGNTASVSADRRIAITITDRRQIIPFAVANPNDSRVVAYAFIKVPGFDDALPQLDRTAGQLTVASESALTFNINDYVIAVGGRKVILVDPTSVRATHSNGQNLVVDSQTLTFTSADTYFGPASVSFKVTDGASASDPTGRTATLVLPITVTPRQNQPPVFNGAVLSFEPGERKTIDLLRLTTYPYLKDLAELRYTAIAAPPVGFDYTITGASLEIRANESAARTTAALTIGVRDALSEGQPGRIALNVVSSTRPLARPVDDAVVAPRGQTTVVDVLANDEAANPFPGKPLSVVAIRGLDGTAIPAGVTVTPNADNSRLTITVAPTAAPIDTNLQYQVSDATKDPARFAYGTIRISVQDRPDPPAAPARADGGYEEGLLTLRLTAPIANNSAITRYEIVSSTGGTYRKDCGTNLRCALTDLVPGQRYQFSVIATNAVGSSDPSPLSALLSADYLPAAPASVSAVATAANPAGGAIFVSWAAVPDPRPGSAVTGYTVRVSGPGVDYSTTVGAATTSLNTTAGGALIANAQYIATVYAKNGALVISDADWRRTSSPPVTTVGPPGQTSGGVSAILINGSNGQVQVNWGPSDPNGGASMTYSVGRFAAGASLPPSCSVGATNPGVASGAAAPVASGWVDTATSDGASYQYVVYADNGLFCIPTASGPVESKSPPGAAAGTTVVQPRGGQADLQVTALSVTSGTASRFEVQLRGSGTWLPVRVGDWLTSAADLSVYGKLQSIVYRGCRDASADFCGPASPVVSLIPINARGEIVSCVVGATPTSRAPVNGNLPTVQYLYSYNDGGPTGQWTPYEEDSVAPPPAPVGSGITSVRLQTVVSFPASVKYRDEGFAEAKCTTQPSRIDSP